MKTLVMMQMMQPQEGAAAGGMSSMLPMLMMMRDDDDSDDSMMMIMMMMSQAQPGTVVVDPVTGLTVAEQSPLTSMLPMLMLMSQQGGAATGASTSMFG